MSNLASSTKNLTGLTAKYIPLPLRFLQGGNR